ncbi:SpoIIE family protein phosphatase [Kitasatospora sp. NPDC057015]|uniref:ATP-binding SpoIIE family protein phosphatase n=1 Tax=Kitasatospora sp. NPDC057015 TaxID=3346001 RepID=UPI003636A918
MNSPHREPDPGADHLDRALLNALFSQSPVGLHLLDPGLRLIRVNAAARLIREFPIDRFLGRSLTEVLRAFDVSDPEFVERTARRVLETGRPVPDLRIRARNRDNPPREAVASVACFRLQDADAGVLGVAFAITDITPRARAEARLRLLNRAATGIGTTLDIFRTAEEICDVVVPDLAEAVAVDVLDPVLRGEAPAAGAVLDNAPLRRAGFRSLADVSRQGVPSVGDVGTYPVGTPYRQALADLAPVLIPHLDENTPWLDPSRRRDSRIIGAGVHSMMVLPMRARGVVLGLVSLYRWRNPLPFDREDLALAEQLTSRAALCLDNARLYSRERSVARILQRDLRQPAGPSGSAVETAHAYLPAGDGGGWFDVIPLSGARVALAAGDTIGHPVNAAAAMGELRAALAALSDLDLPPDEILERLHDLAGQPGAAPGGEPPEDACRASCLYAVYDPVNRLCTMSSAGHPPPVLIHPNGEVEPLVLPAGPMLGQATGRYAVHERTLPEGSTLLLYNPALLGAGPAPDHSEPALGGSGPALDALRRVTATARASLQDTCDAIADALAPEQPVRDIVLLLARTHGLDAEHTASWTLPGSLRAAAEARKLATAQLAAWGLEELTDSTQLIVSELVTNAVRYADGPVRLRLLRDRTLICEISDDSSTAPRLRRADDADEGGRGLFITAQLTDRWGVRPGERGKTIWAEQPLPPPTAPDGPGEGPSGAQGS